ncbi:intermembrane phospholipid transport protein YdbH family protein [Shigella flexneri]
MVKSSTVNLNYHHEENIFTLWRSLRFGDNLQAWFSRTYVCREMTVRKEKSVRKNNENFTGCVDVIFYAGWLYASH